MGRLENIFTRILSLYIEQILSINRLLHRGSPPALASGHGHPGRKSPFTDYTAVTGNTFRRRRATVAEKAVILRRLGLPHRRIEPQLKVKVNYFASLFVTAFVIYKVDLHTVVYLLNTLVQGHYLELAI